MESFHKLNTTNNLHTSNLEDTNDTTVNSPTREYNSANNGTQIHDTPNSKTSHHKRIRKRIVRLDLKENQSPVRNNATSEPRQPKSIMKKVNNRATTTARERGTGQQQHTTASVPFSFNSPNSPAEASFLVRNKKTPGRAHSTPLRPSEISTPKSGRIKYVEKEQRNNTAHARRHDIISLLRYTVVSCYKLSQQWQQLKKQGAAHLQDFVAQKLDSHGRVTKELDFMTVISMTEISAVIKNMCKLMFDMKHYVSYVTDLEQMEEQFDVMKPFDTLALSTIASMLHNLSKRFSSEFTYKKEACEKLLLACGHYQPTADSADLLNNILSIWTSDVYIKRKDPHLIALMHEVKGFDDQ